MRHTIGLEGGQPVAKCGFATCHCQPVGKPDRTCDLWLQQAHQIAVAHRRQRMILHRAFGERLLADKQIAHEDRPAIFRKGRAVDGLISAKIIHQRLSHRADIAVGRTVEGRAIFPEEPVGAGGPQPVQRGPAFQRDHLERRGILRRCLRQTKA